MKKICCVCAALALSLTLALPLSGCADNRAPLSEYEIVAAYDGCDVLTGNEKFTFYNSTDNALDCLKFNLWGNAYREDAVYKPVSDAYATKAYYDGASFGSMKIDAVEGCASWEVGGVDENILTVCLEEPVYPEGRVEVTIAFTLKLANVNHRTGVTESTVNLGNFYPVLCAYTVQGFIETPYYSCGDPFVSECANYDVTLKLPPEYAAATSGKEISRSSEEGCLEIRYELNGARDFAAVLSDNFKTVQRNVNGCLITLYYTQETEPESLADATCESFAYFCDTFGAYPYPTLSVVSTPLYVGGMEYPALTMISASLDSSDGAYTAVHETAHQWWYAAVGSNQIECAWQDEGLAEYSTLCFFEKNPSYGFTRTAILGSAIKAYRAYYSVYNQIFGKADTSMCRTLDEYSSEYEYVNVAYNKGLLLFESARTAMGDDKFFGALADYYTNNKFTVASPEELISRLAAKHDVEGIIESYIEGKVII